MSQIPLINGLRDVNHFPVRTYVSIFLVFLHPVFWDMFGFDCVFIEAKGGFKMGAVVCLLCRELEKVHRTKNGARRIRVMIY